MIDLINTEAGQNPIGPYSQAVVANGFIFCSGTAGIDPNTQELVQGLANQTRQAFNNLKEVLSAAGSDLSKVVKVTVFLKDMESFGEMNEVYKEIFGNHNPARTTVEVSDLPKREALVVVELVAVVNG